MVDDGGWRVSRVGWVGPRQWVSQKWLVGWVGKNEWVSQACRWLGVWSLPRLNRTSSASSLFALGPELFFGNQSLFRKRETCGGEATVLPRKDAHPSLHSIHQLLFWSDSVIVSSWLLSLTQLPESDICQLTPPTLDDDWWMVGEWLMDDEWMNCGWIMDELWMINDDWWWLMNDLWMISGWMMWDKKSSTTHLGMVSAAYLWSWLGHGLWHCFAHININEDSWRFAIYQKHQHHKGQTKNVSYGVKHEKSP